MKYVGEINFVMLVLLAISIAIDIGLVNILTRSLDARDRLAKVAKTHDKRVADLVAALQEQAREITVLQGDKADLHEALTECQDKYKALERQTVEVEVVKPVKPKRTATRKKEVESNG